VQAARWSMDRSYGDRAITFALGEVERLAKSTTTLRMLEDLIESARTAYKGGSIARSVVLLFLESSEEWASEAQEWVVELCREMKQPDHPTRQALTRSLLEYLNQLETNRALEQRVESIVQGWLQSGSVALALK
jgi:uncharacterized membrane-anchored protein YjiN (DUF445 family)